MRQHGICLGQEAANFLRMRTGLARYCYAGGLGAKKVQLDWRDWRARDGGHALVFGVHRRHGEPGDHSAVDRCANGMVANTVANTVANMETVRKT